MAPESGLIRPRIILSRTDFPAPLGPSSIIVWPRARTKLTLRSTTLSSNASETVSKATAGVADVTEGRLFAPSSACAVCVGIEIDPFDGVADCGCRLDTDLRPAREHQPQL